MHKVTRILLTTLCITILIIILYNLNAQFLWDAAGSGDNLGVCFALKTGANVDYVVDSQTPLMRAIGHHDSRIVQKLLEHGASLTPELEKDSGSVDVVDYAASSGDPDSLAVVLKYSPQSDISQLFMSASCAGNLANVKFLARREGTGIFEVKTKRTNPSSDYGETALHVAGSDDVASFLVENGVYVHSVTAKGNTPLHTAHIGEVARFLIEHGASVNARNIEKQTSLHCAVSGWQADVASELLHHSADVSARDSEGNTPLHYCCNEKIAKMLILAGANRAIRNNHGDTPSERLNRLGDTRMSKYIDNYGSM